MPAIGSSEVAAAAPGATVPELLATPELPGAPTASEHPEQQERSDAAVASAVPSVAATEGWSATSHWQRVDGHVHYELFSAPAFTMASGQWEAVDSTLRVVADAAFPYAAEGAFRPLRLGLVPSRLAQFELAEGPVTLTVPGLALGLPDVSVPNRVRHLGVGAAGPELTFDVLGTGLRQSFVLPSSSSPRSFTTHVSDPLGQLGVPVQQPNGGWLFGADFDGTVRLFVSPATAYEQAAEASEPGPGRDPDSATVSVARTGDGWDIVETVDAAWLVGKTFPVVLDPTFAWVDDPTRPADERDETSDCYLVSSPPHETTNFCSTAGNDELGVGNAGWRARTLFSVDIQLLNPYTKIIDSKLRLMTKQAVPSNAAQQTIIPYQNGEIWDPAEATWAYPTVGGSWDDPGGGGSSFAPHPSSTIATPLPTWTDWNLTDLTQTWLMYESSVPNLGVVLRSATELSQTGVFYWYSSRYPMSSKWPRLIADIVETPDAPPITSLQPRDGGLFVDWDTPPPNASTPFGPITEYQVRVYTRTDPPVLVQSVTVPCSTSCTTSRTFSGLTNGAAYYVVLEAANNPDGLRVRTGFPTSSATVTPQALPAIVKSRVGSAPAGGYGEGDVLRFKLTLTHPSAGVTGALDYPIEVTVHDTVTGTGGGNLRLLEESLVLESTGTALCAAPAACTLNAGGTELDLDTPVTVTKAAPTVLYVDARAVAPSAGCGTVSNAAKLVSDATGAESATSTLNTTVCAAVADTALGLEPWWTQVSRTLGPQAVAQVNVGTGNLTLQQTDSTPVLARGRLAHLLRRTYNSHAALPAVGAGEFGAGWSLNTGSVELADGLDVEAAILKVPSASSVLSPLAVTLVDRDGTSHRFTVKSVLGRGTVPAQDLTALTGAAGAVAPAVLFKPAGYARLCADVTFQPPAGVHLALWRYVAVKSSTCRSDITSSQPVVVGYASMRPDRLRAEYAPTGELLALTDGSGVNLRYAYDNVPAVPTPVSLGRLRAVYEGRDCATTNTAGTYVTPDDVPATCRATRLTWTEAAGHLSRVEVTDPANRRTVYFFHTLPGTAADVLGVVVNPPETAASAAAGQPVNEAGPASGISADRVIYGYHGDTDPLYTRLAAGQTLSCGGSAGQLCHTMDPRGIAAGGTAGRSRFSYATAPTTPPRVATHVDRLGITTTFAYATNATAGDTTTVRRSGQESVYRFGDPRKIDDTLPQVNDPARRVWEVDEGAVGASEFKHVTQFDWDGYERACQRLTAPSTGFADNNLCGILRRGPAMDNPATTPDVENVDETTTFSYNDAGMLLFEAKSARDAVGVLLAGSPVTRTWGYSKLYTTTDGQTVRSTQHVTGSRQHSPDSPASPNPDSVLYVLADRDQELGPRGNAAGSGFANYLTTHVIANNPAVAPSVTPLAPVCPSAAQTADTGVMGNTGAVCRSRVAANPDGTREVSRFEYDNYGARTAWRDPRNVLAESEAGMTPASYAYSYLDTSDPARAGWLRAVTDPAQKFVAFDYDAAGNVTRTWDRNATAGRSLAEFPLCGRTGATSPCNHPAQMRYRAGTIPWRYLTETVTPEGDTTQRTVDANGYLLQLRPPRGVTANNDTFTVRYCTDADGKTRSQLLPEQATTSNDDCFDSGVNLGRTLFTYDDFGNNTSVTDPLGDVTIHRYDAVNRRTKSATDRGPWSSTEERANCDQSDPVDDAPIASNRIVCATSSSYDSLDNVIATSDANDQVTTVQYDSLHRPVVTLAPPYAGGSSRRTEAQYDAEGNVTVICPPREFTEGPGVCPASGAATPGRYSTYRTSDLQGRPLTDTRYRQIGTELPAGPTPPAAPSGIDTLTSSWTYNTAGNLAASTDPRGTAASSPYTTIYAYDLLNRRTQVAVPRSGSGATVSRNAHTWTYDPSGNVATMSRAGGPTTGYTYDFDNRPIDTVVGLSGDRSSALSNAAAGANLRSRTLYTNGLVTTQYRPRAFQPDATPIHPVTGTPDPRYATQYTYDREGRPTSAATPRWDTTTGDTALTNDATIAVDCPTSAGTYGVCTTSRDYDDAGRLVRITTPALDGATGRHAEYTYTPDGLLHSIATANPSSSDPDDRVSTLRLYDGAGRAVTTRDPRGYDHDVSYEPDGAVRTTSEQGPEDRTANLARYLTTVTRDAHGNPRTNAHTLTAGSEVSSATYNSDDTLRSSSGTGTSATDTGRDVTTYGYDANANITSIGSPAATATRHGAPDPTSRHGTAIEQYFTLDNLLAEVRRPADRQSATGNGRQRITLYGYDAAGRKTSQEDRLRVAGVDTSAGSQLFAYNSAGLLSQQQGRPETGLRATINTTYNADGQPLTTVHTPAGGTPDTLHRNYYLDGLLRTASQEGGSSVANRTAHTAYAYDGDGNLTARRYTPGQKILTAPHVVLNPNSAPDPEDTKFGYNNAGLLDAMYWLSSSWTWAYDDLGRRQTQSQSRSGSPFDTVQWTYEDEDADTERGDLLVNQTLHRGGALLASWDYAYDSRRRITGQTHTGPPSGGAPGVGVTSSAHTFHYDSHGRIDSYTRAGTTTTIGWDHNGNRTTFGALTYTYDADDSMLTKSDVNRPYTYSAAGTMATDPCTTYTYDGFDRLTSAAPQTRINGCALPTPPTVTYRYNGEDQQTERRENLLTGPDKLTVFDYDPSDGAVLGQDATPNQHTSWAVNAAGTSLAVRRGGTDHYLTDDGTGTTSTIVGAPGTTPAIVCATRFDPFGSPVSGSAPCPVDDPATTTDESTPNDVYYRGERRDSLTGTYQLGARTYAPDRAAFHNPDTYRTGGAGANQGINTDPLTANRYTYVNGDPLNFSDPTGHMAAANDSSGGYSEEEIEEAQKRGEDMFKRGWNGPKKCRFCISNIARKAAKGLVYVAAVAAVGAVCVATAGGCVVVLAGAAIGGAISGVGCRDESATKIAQCVANGAAVGALASAAAVATGGTAGVTLAGALKAGAAAGAVESVANDLVHERNVDVTKAVVHAAVGAATAGVLHGAGTKLAALRSARSSAAEGASGLGDLTGAEVRSIQGTVNQAGRSLDVVGSTARGERRFPGSDLPIGKGAGTRSDIDYLVPHGNVPYYESTGLYKDLPDNQGIIAGIYNPFQGPSIRFEPFSEPFFIPGAS